METYTYRCACGHEFSHTYDDGLDCIQHGADLRCPKCRCMEIDFCPPLKAQLEAARRARRAERERAAEQSIQNLELAAEGLGLR